MLDSEGSLGANRDHANVSQVLVKNCQLESTTNGLRIKTWQVSYLQFFHSDNYLIYERYIGFRFN